MKQSKISNLMSVLHKSVFRQAVGRREVSPPTLQLEISQHNLNDTFLSDTLDNREQRSPDITFSQAQHELGSKLTESAYFLLLLLQTLMSTVSAVVLWRAFILLHIALHCYLFFPGFVRGKQNSRQRHVELTHPREQFRQ